MKQPLIAPHSFFPELQTYLNAIVSGFDSIPGERKADLEKVAAYTRGRLDDSQSVRLIFICTHNSRRSHLAQIWAHVAAEFFGLFGIETYSGGTEATALNPRVVAALRRAGLKITADDPTASNPKYSVQTSAASSSQICFSKVYDAPPNPTTRYCAVMTCSQADDACPVVKGCDLRTPIRYEDPKVADDTATESQCYDERTRQICTEMIYMMSLVAP